MLGVVMFLGVSPGRRITACGYSTAACEVTGSVITCSLTDNDPNITSTHVRNAGDYTLYESGVINSGITRIMEGAFFGCSSLIEVSLPNTLVEIEFEAFCDCALRTLTLPSSITSLSSAAFNGCWQLTDVYMPTASSNYREENGMIFNKTKDGYSGLVLVGAGRNAMGTLQLPSVTGLLGSCCRRSMAKEIVIPDTVVSVGTYVFYTSPYLERIVVGAKVKTWSATTLAACRALKEIVVSTSNKVMKTSSGIFGSSTAIFWVDPVIETANIAKGITTLGRTAFQEAAACTKVTAASGGTFSVLNEQLIVKSTALIQCVGGATEVTVPSSVTSIEHSAFRGCVKVTSIVLHSKVTMFADSVFRECYSLKKVDFKGCTMKNSNNAAETSSYMFTDCWELEEIVSWPGTNFALALDTFSMCGFKVLDISNKVTKIAERAISFCTKLETVVIPNTVTSIAEQAFYSCSSLKTVTFTATSKVKTLGAVCFGDCIALKEITIPASVTTLPVSCFSGDSSLISIKVQDGGSYTSDGVAVYEGSSSYNKIIICPPGVTEMILPDTTTVVGSKAFHRCTKLVSVLLRNKIKTFEDYAFCECPLLTEISIPSSITNIGYGAFDGCVGIQTVLYCSSSSQGLTYNGDPFPSSTPRVYAFYDFKSGEKFCGHTVTAILDHNCNIPTESFTVLYKSVHSRNKVLRISASICFSYSISY